MKNSICIICAYFGKFNNYFPLWLKSCQYNPKIDFLIFNDCDPVENVPENVKLIPFSLIQMKELAIEKTGVKNLYLDKPYKCCDFKPVYGEIFSEYISEYEYWGHCDLDLIWGDLYGYLIRYDYKKYDKFLNLGHLSLYRNTAEVNHRYVDKGGIDSYEEAFIDKMSTSFDENRGMSNIYLYNKYPFFFRRIYADISPIYHRYKLSEYCALDAPDKNYEFQVFFWENGKTYRAYIGEEGQIQIEEFMYIHFQKRPNYTFDKDCLSANSFFLTNKGFIKKTQNVITVSDINSLNKYVPIVENVEWTKWKLLSYWCSVKRRIFKNG